MSTREKAGVFLAKSDAFIADLGLSQAPECWASYGARIVRDLLADVAALRLALETATRENATLKDVAFQAQNAAIDLAAQVTIAERERDEARRIAAEHRCVEINPANCPTCSALSRPAPPADAATEAKCGALVKVAVPLSDGMAFPGDGRDGYTGRVEE